jgi:cytochrome c551/c552
MHHFRLTLAAAAVVALGLPAQASAQNGMTVDASLAKRGKTVWQNTGCMICHRIHGGRSAGPDLAGLFERRTLDWATRFLKNTPEMLETDSIAKALLDDFKKMKMPQVKLTDNDIQAVLHYIAQESDKKKG